MTIANSDIPNSGYIAAGIERKNGIRLIAFAGMGETTRGFCVRPPHRRESMGDRF
jgi:hypothetical protein